MLGGAPVSEMVAVPELGGGSSSRTSVRSLPWVLVPAFWLAAAVPVSGVGWLLAVAGAALPLTAPRVLPLMVLTSCFFYSTMAVGSSVLYALRAWWIGAFLIWLLVLRGERVERRVWLWVAAVGTLLAWGTLVATVRVGHVEEAARAPFLEAGVAFVWVLGLLVGWGWLRPARGRLQPGEVAAIAGAWLVALGYGIAQFVFGVNESTVPADVWPQLEGFRQYEDLGRHPFASLTSNGMAATSMLPVVMLLGVAHRSLPGTAITLLLALVVAALTLTRSYIAVLVLLLLFLVPLQRTRTAVWLVMVVAVALGAAVALRALDPELLSLSLRLEGDASSLRTDIWAYTLREMTAGDWLLGMGFGSGGWERFFAPMALLKELHSPHSSVLEVTGQFGLLGLAVYLAIAGTILRAYLMNRSEPALAAIPLALLLVMARELVAASYVFSPSILGTFFWVAFGMVLAQSSGRRDLPPSVA